MNFRQLLTANRSYRRFHQDRPLDEKTLVGLVELTRLCPASANRQPLRYMVSCSPEQNARIFPHLAWAGALRDWPGPAEGERPTGYIIILGDPKYKSFLSVDSGIAAQSMLLGAVEQGLGGCMIGSIDRPALGAELGLPEHLAIRLVVALGHPAEKVVLEEGPPEPRPYWREADGVHHVPKRPLEELLVEW